MPKQPKAVTIRALAEIASDLDDNAMIIRDCTCKIDDLTASLPSGTPTEKLTIINHHTTKLIRSLNAIIFDIKVLAQYISTDRDDPVLGEDLNVRKITEAEKYVLAQKELLKKLNASLEEIISGMHTKEDKR